MTVQPESATAWGLGLASVARNDVVLDVWYPSLGLGALPPQWRGPYGVPAELASLAVTDTARGVRHEIVHTEIDLATPPANTQDAYLRLHLLSHRHIAPFGANLDGLMDVLPKNIWTSAGPCSVDDFSDARLRIRIASKGAPLTVYAVSKVPRMADYVVPTDVVITDAARVRLGAHLAPGTQVRHEGFVDLNAGTTGPALIQGRISEGVIVAANTHIGGSASLLPPSDPSALEIGEDCLVGANAGVGINLGQRCVVEAGLFLTAGTKVTVRTAHHPHPRVVAAYELAGTANLLFRRNSTTGIVEAFERDE